MDGELKWRDDMQQVARDQASEQDEARPKQARGRFQKGVSGNPSGRRRGAASKQTIAALTGLYGSPLEFLLRLMSDENAKMSDRVDAARAALPYTNRRLPEFAPDKVPPLTEAEDAAQREREREYAQFVAENPNAFSLPMLGV
jgi:hypothetical protein